jgi:hypothetical protein
MNGIKGVNNESDQGQAQKAAEMQKLSVIQELSERPYSVRVADPNDFAHAMENAVGPALVSTLDHHFEDYSVDVHIFPEESTEAVPREIHVRVDNKITPGLEEKIRHEVANTMPARFHPVHVHFCQGNLQKTSWIGSKDGPTDDIGEARNITFRDSATIGMSIGPSQMHDVASMGGIIQVESDMFVMSAFHAFQDALARRNLLVTHPAYLDLVENRFQNRKARSYEVGSLAMWSGPRKTRPSRTFAGTNINNQVEMDWSLTGPVRNATNVVAMPTFSMGNPITVDRAEAVTGNTEVYTMARNSGYSLGFTSDTPGFQKFGGVRHREWTVRQYSPWWKPKSARSSVRRQTPKQRLAGNIGVKGDAGAWLMRRSDNAVIGLICARNHKGLAYFTPIVDVLDDIQEISTDGQVKLPAAEKGEKKTAASTTGSPTTDACSECLPSGPCHAALDPWTLLNRNELRQFRHMKESIIPAGLSWGFSRTLAASFNSGEGRMMQSLKASVGAGMSVWQEPAALPSPAASTNKTVGQPSLVAVSEYQNSPSTLRTHGGLVFCADMAVSEFSYSSLSSTSSSHLSSFSRDDDQCIETASIVRAGMSNHVVGRPDRP